YLFRLSGKTDQALGIPFRNRHSRAAKSAVGCFIEVPPIQVDVQPADTFEALFERIQSDTMAVLSHGQLSISNSETTPLFDVTFNFLAERYPAFAGMPTQATFTTGLHAFGPLSEAPLSYWPGGESLNVHCQDYRGDGRYTLWFDFHALYFDTAQRLRAIEHFRNLLDAALANPSQALAQVELVSANERHQLVHDFNPPWLERDANETVATLFQRRARQCPERLALRYRDKTLSYGELDLEAEKLAGELRRRGIGPEELVGVLLERSPHVPIALLGTLKAGGAYVPLDPSHPATRNAVVMEDARPKVVITERALRGHGAIPAEAAVLCMEDLDSERAEPPPGSAACGENTAYVLFTSGSSGRPKGVAIPHSALVNFLMSMQQKPGLDASDHVLAITTVAFDIAALELFLPLVTGASLELVDSATASDPTLLSALVAERRPTVIQATPATWQMLLEIGWQGDPRLKALCGGEALPADLAIKLVERVGELWNMYGPTETTVWSSLDRIDRQRPLPVTIGRPIENTVIYVVNDAMKLAPIGVAGEICIGGAGVARGYYNNTELTRTRFVEDTISPRTGGRLYRTGDLGVWRADGRLECLGRVDFQVKIRGFRIELGEIESVLLGYSGVASAVVVAREDRPGDKHLAAYVVPRTGSNLDVRGLRAFVQERLPSYMVPAAYSLLSALPLTPNGKVDRKALPKPEMAATAVHEPPKSDMEMRVAAIFEKLLGVTTVGRHDNFFELGGHSLLAAQLLVRLNRISKSPLGIGQIFQKPTVMELSKLVLEGGTSDDPLVLPLNRVTSGTPLFCICGIHLYTELANALGSGNPVYGVYLPAEERGVAAAAQGKHLSVEELAQGYLSAVRRQQPKGPYCLAGVSFGGVLAYEMAQQLRRAGEEVALLAMFDSALPRAKRRRWLRWLSAHAAAAMEKGTLEYLAHRLRKFSARFKAQVPVVPEQVPAEMQFRVGVYLQASRIYNDVVQPYPGTILLFRANARDDFEGYELDPYLGWGDLARHVEVFDAPGSHLGILLEPGVRTLAAPIRAALDRLAVDAAPVESEVPRGELPS
ncbi:MAG TPA: amino acid adenylation domain-containing protein, partial [Polyangiaceae bacterium]